MTSNYNPYFFNAESQGELANIAERTEISGLARSQRDNTLLWGINDAGGIASIFAIGTDGSDRGAWTLQGATNVDWEDISSVTINDIPYLYIGDIGDNSSIRSTGVIYRAVEPIVTDTNDGTILSGNIETITYQYPDTPAGETYVGTPARRDAETLMVDPVTGDIFIISKRETVSRIFKLAYSALYAGTQTLIYVGDVTGIVDAVGGPVPGNVTSGDFSPNGLEAIIRTYDNVYYFSRSNTSMSATNMLLSPVTITAGLGVGLAASGLEPQGEAIVFDHDGLGYYTVSEQAGGLTVYLYHYRRRRLRNLKRSRKTHPRQV